MLYRFHIELSDVDRGIYESLDFRASQHPSESIPYLLTRTLAFILSPQGGLEFTAQGLGDPEGPALRALSRSGILNLWIEIGNPSARKLHKATKAAKKVVVYTYKNAELLVAEIRSNDVHKGDGIEIYSFDSAVLHELELKLEKNNKWSVLVQDQQMSIEAQGQSILLEIKRHSAAH